MCMQRRLARATPLLLEAGVREQELAEVLLLGDKHIPLHEDSDEAGEPVKMVGKLKKIALRRSYSLLEKYAKRK